jgi:hypothetical protein
MGSIAGTWDLIIRTPIGSLPAVYVFTDNDTGMTGTAESGNELVSLVDIAHVDTPHGHRVTWRQTVTKPMRLRLAFDVTVAGDALVGHSRAGRLPPSTVTGTRRTQPAHLH